jgi:predicted kinase
MIKRFCDRDYKPISTGNILIMMMGLPRSGKSTWAREQGYPIVDCDAIRLAKTGQRWWGPIEHEIWPFAKTMIRSLFLAGHKIVILDSTSLIRNQRDRFINADDIQWDRYVKIINTHVDICKQRALNTYPDLVPVIDWFDAHKEDLHLDEDIRIWE